MKKISSIVLIFILLFNLCGYRFLLAALEKKSSVQLEAAIDRAEYNESELIEIQVPLNMPYQQRYTGFERHYGQIEINGVVYNYVKRKIDGDVLILKCIPNHSIQQLKKTADELAKSNSGQDQDNTGKKQSSSFTKNVSGDYYNNSQLSFLSGSIPATRIFTKNFSSALNDVLILKPHQPPRA